MNDSMRFDADFGVVTDKQGNVKEWKNMSDEKSRTEELDQLRADHAAIRSAVEVHKKYGRATPSETIDHIEQRIAKLESKSYDPWRDAKRIVSHYESSSVYGESVAIVVGYVRHLEDENAAKDARIAELEACEVPPLDLASLDRRLAAIEQRLDAEDMYRQEQNERSE